MVRLYGGLRIMPHGPWNTNTLIRLARNSIYAWARDNGYREPGGLFLEKKPNPDLNFDAEGWLAEAPTIVATFNGKISPLEIGFSDEEYVFLSDKPLKLFRKAMKERAREKQLEVRLSEANARIAEIFS